MDRKKPDNRLVQSAVFESVRCRGCGTTYMAYRRRDNVRIVEITSCPPCGVNTTDASPVSDSKNREAPSSTW